MNQRICLLTLSLALFAKAAGAESAQPTEEYALLPTSSAEFTNSATASIQRLASTKFTDGLISAELGARNREELLREIQRENAIAGVSKGQAGVHYDVVLQPGHYGRTTGLTGAQGALVSERALVTFIAREAAAELRKRGLNVLVISADDYVNDDAATDAWEGIHAKAFLALHADGSTQPCRSGPSVAYPALGYAAGTAPFAMHAIALSLSQALGYPHEQFMKDNFTANEARYYMFRHVRADTVAGLLEVGEVTCPNAEERLIVNSEALAHNIAHALDFLATMPATQR